MANSKADAGNYVREFGSFVKAALRFGYNVYYSEARFEFFFNIFTTSSFFILTFIKVFLSFNRGAQTFNSVLVGVCGGGDSLEGGFGESLNGLDGLEDGFGESLNGLDGLRAVFGVKKKRLSNLKAGFAGKKRSEIERKT